MFRAFIRKLNKCSKGTTLIEVIVSLLILMIIFTPMLMSFVTAAKTNVASKKQMYANALAENVMEAVKVLGIEKTARQFYLGPGEVFKLASGSSIAPEEVVPPLFSQSIVVDADGNKLFADRGTEKYVYVIKNAEEGTESYDIQITFSSANYTTTPTPVVPTVTPAVTPAITPSLLPNDYSFADMSAFNAISTALLNPMSSGVDYDYLAKQYFKQLHENYYYDKWIEDCVAVDEANNAIWAAYEDALEEAIANGTTPPTPPTLTELPVQTPTINDDVLYGYISKETNISMKKVTIDYEGTQKYCLNADVTYSFNNSGGYCANPLTQPTLVRNYAGFCDDVMYDKISSLYFIYVPFVSAADLSRESINIENDLVDELDIYIAIQAPMSTVFNSPLHIYLTGTGGTEKMNLYSQAALTCDKTVNGTSDVLLKNLGSSSARLYEVTVDVFTHEDSNKLATLTSTIFK